MSNKDNNPYQPPEADLSTPLSATDADQFTFSGVRKVPAMRGWGWIKEAFGLFSANPGVWILLALVYFVVVIVLSFIPFIGPLALNLLNPVFIAGMMLGCLAIYRRQEFSVGHLFKGFQIPQTGRLVLAGLVYMVLLFGLMAIVGFLGFAALGGSGLMEALMGSGQFSLGLLLMFLVMMLVMMPVIMLMYFAPPLIALSDLSLMDALKTSFSGCLKNIFPFLIFGVIGIVLAILASIPLMLGWLVMVPVGFASMFVAYRDIFTNAPAYEKGL